MIEHMASIAAILVRGDFNIFGYWVHCDLWPELARQKTPEHYADCILRHKLCIPHVQEDMQ